MGRPETDGAAGNRAAGYRLIAGYIGIVMILSGAITMLPLLTLIFYPRELGQARYFILPGIVAIVIGYMLSLAIRGRKPERLERNQEMVILVATWIVAISVTAFPFVLTGRYTFTQAVFETTSGLSTTGLSVVDTAAAPHIFLIHRTVLLFFGGIGLVLVMTSVLSDVYGMRLYSAEGHSDRLLPNLLESARLIIGIYSGYILGGIVLYTAFGMSLFDAVNHSVAALSTGGFSTRPESIGYYNSQAIEVITILLMLLGSTNFFVHLLLLKGKFRFYASHCETRALCFILAFITPVVVVLLFQNGYNNLSEGFRAAIFQIVSALTTTGFQTVESFAAWSPALMLIMTALMLIGGSAGSTAGGIKLYRLYVLYRETVWELKRTLFPGRQIFTETVPRYGKTEPISAGEKSRINSFVFLYLSVFLAGTFIFCLQGHSIQDSMFEFSSALSTVGLSAGITGYDAPPIVHWTATAGMFLGRLEIFAVMICFARLTGDMKRQSKRWGQAFHSKRTGLLARRR